MAEEPTNLVLEHLRHIRKQIDDLREDTRELKSTVSGILQILAADQNWKIRLETRLERIEKHLELHDPALPG